MISLVLSDGPLLVLLLAKFESSALSLVILGLSVLELSILSFTLAPTTVDCLLSFNRVLAKEIICFATLNQLVFRFFAEFNILYFFSKSKSAYNR